MHFAKKEPFIFFDHTIGKAVEQARVARWHIFKPKDLSLGKFWRVLKWKMMLY
jgi:hypothetical protein